MLGLGADRVDAAERRREVKMCAEKLLVETTPPLFSSKQINYKTMVSPTSTHFNKRDGAPFI